MEPAYHCILTINGGSSIIKCALFDADHSFRRILKGEIARIGSFAAVLGRLDTLVFAGGIGETAPVVRARICDGLEFLEIELAEKTNTANEGMISSGRSRVAVRVIRTNEG